MNAVEVGAGLTLALGFIGWIAATEWRLRDLQNSLLKSQELLKDADIKDQVHTLTDAELNDLLSTRLQPTSKPET